MSNDKPRVPDENDRLQAGQLSPNPFDGTKRIEPDLHLVDSKMRKIGEPADVHAEVALLGALLWAGANQPDLLRVDIVLDLLPNGRPFFSRDRGYIFDGIVACRVKDDATGHKPVEHDPVAVAQHIAIAGNGKDATGIEALLKLKSAASTVSEVQARAYAGSIRECWSKREAIRDLRLIVSDALSPKVTDAQIYERAEAARLAMMERAQTTGLTVSARQSAEQLFKRLMEDGNQAVPTGLTNVDEMLNGGVRAGETSLVAARTNVGKSTVAVDISEFMVAKDPTAGVLYVTMEMPHESLTMKMLAARTPGVTVAMLRRKSMNENQWRDLTAAVGAIKDLEQLHFTVSLQQTLASIFSIARDRQRVLRKIGMRLVMVVIDHMGLVKPSQELLKRATRQQQVAETSRGLRYIATEVGCHVMGLVQIHRDSERQKNPKAMPKLHHLREAGDLEQDADQILIMHRPRDPVSNVFIAGKPTAFGLAKGRLDDTAVTLLDFKNGRYCDWTDPDRTFATEYGSESDD